MASSVSDYSDATMDLSVPYPFAESGGKGSELEKWPSSNLGTIKPYTYEPVASRSGKLKGETITRTMVSSFLLLKHRLTHISRCNHAWALHFAAYKPGVHLLW